VTKSKTERIIASRLKLRDRFLKRLEKTPGIADAKPLGSGPTNRHGMPQLPPQQKVSKKWPVLDLGEHPDISRDSWRLTVDGCCSEPRELGFSDLMTLPQVEDTSDFHCVTGWSKLDLTWQGVRFSELAASVGVTDEASFILCHGYDGYTTNLPLEEALKGDVLLAHTVAGAPLPKDHGGPVRLMPPQLWAWKGTKWLKRIEFLTHDVLGFWEERGYSNTAHPWRNDRYGEDGPPEGAEIEIEES